MSCWPRGYRVLIAFQTILQGLPAWAVLTNFHPALSTHGSKRAIFSNFLGSSREPTQNCVPGRSYEERKRFFSIEWAVLFIPATQNRQRFLRSGPACFHAYYQTYIFQKHVRTMSYA